ncbi:MAG: alpha/beta fold hydrolase [Anaerolineales bacterium]|nr:alpha/beta fold hydrolase [Anaerolineales bacterium]
MTIVLQVLLAVLVLLALYVVYANYAYNRVLPQSRPCVDCTSPVHVNGYDLYYRELGTDKGLPPVILVHGGPGHSSLSFKNGFDFLAEETRVIFYDQRGSGNSQIKPNPEDYTIEQLMEELEALRHDLVKADKVILIGHSFGSALVQRYALKYPEHVEKMVIAGGIRINNGMSNRFVWKYFGGALYSTSLGLPPADPKAADEWFTKSSEKDNPNRLFDKKNTAILEDTGTVSFAPWREISFSLTGYDYKTELSQLQVPTLFIYGTADSPYTGKPVADELCATLPNCRSVEFTQSGHWAFLEEPEKFQQVIRDFLIPNP